MNEKDLRDYTDASAARVEDTKDFERIYGEHSRRVYQYVYARLGIRSVSEEVVQDVFLSFWHRRASIVLTGSIEYYLIGAAKNKVLDYMRREAVKKRYASEFLLFLSEKVDNHTEQTIEFNDLKTRIDSCISTLPERCRHIFTMSRMEHLSIQEISLELKISKRTVENYLSVALRELRTCLGDILTLLIIILTNFLR